MVSAVLVDIRLPLAAISALEVGQILPVPVARAVPVRVGGQTIAHGTVGALDDRLAVQLTHAF
jgi:flagellar motor switch protein FliM